MQCKQRALFVQASEGEVQAKSSIAYTLETIDNQCECKQFVQATAKVKVNFLVVCVRLHSTKRVHFLCKKYAFSKLWFVLSSIRVFDQSGRTAIYHK